MSFDPFIISEHSDINNLCTSTLGVIEVREGSLISATSRRNVPLINDSKFLGGLNKIVGELDDQLFYIPHNPNPSKSNNKKKKIKPVKKKEKPNKKK